MKQATCVSISRERLTYGEGLLPSSSGREGELIKTRMQLGPSDKKRNLRDQLQRRKSSTREPHGGLLEFCNTLPTEDL